MLRISARICFVHFCTASFGSGGGTKARPTLLAMRPQKPFCSGMKDMIASAGDPGGKRTCQEGTHMTREKLCTISPWQLCAELQKAWQQNADAGIKVAACFQCTRAQNRGESQITGGIGDSM